MLTEISIETGYPKVNSVHIRKYAANRNIQWTSSAHILTVARRVTNYIPQSGVFNRVFCIPKMSLTFCKGNVPITSFSGLSNAISDMN